MALVLVFVKYPAGQTLQSSSRLTPPELPLNRPTGQGTGEAEPVGQKYPGKQGLKSHTAAPTVVE